MNTEQKAKAYDMALEVARKELKQDLHESGVWAIQRIFPELRESEDEIARKWLVALVENLGEPADEDAEKELEEMRPLALAYLEKQKENPKSADSIPSNCTSNAKYEDIWHKVSDSLPDNTREVLCKDAIGNYFIGRYYSKGIWEISMYDDCDKSNEDNPPVVMWIDIPSEKQKEQKPVEKKIALNGFEKALDSFLFDFAHSSITDCEPKEYIKNHSAYLIKAAYKELNAQLKQDLFEAQQEGRREGYEAAKNELKPTEWSEEDEKMLQRIIRHTESEYQDWCNDKYGNSEIVSDGKRGCLERLDWLEKLLKSLRPQPHWKPSEQEKGALRTAIHILTEERSFPKAAGHLQAILDAFEGKESRKDWKPSEEQMNYLCAAVDAAIRKHNESVSGYEPAIVLKSLYEQLQKLM